MSRTEQEPNPVSTLKNRLRLAEQTASDVVLAVESLRTALRQVVAAVDDLPRDRVPLPAPVPPPRPIDPPSQPVATRFLPMKTVAQLCGLSRTTIWRMEREGDFPQRRRIGPNAVRWLAGEVENWIQTRQHGR